jgi:ribosomal protein S18
MADLRVDIAAEFVGKKAFKDADNAAVRLDKTIKKLGRTLGVTLGASAIIAYSKASVKAFSDDEAAARRLSSAVDNLGLSFSKVQVATFISDLERTASIADDVLRPAFQSLLNITGSLTKSQELLNNAIQISRASGVDLATVTNDLGKGYVGITRGLIKYNTGLTRAELQTKGFNEILGIMLAKSAGAAQDYLTTTSFKMDTLALASENAKETIGKGLVDAFARIGGGTEAKDAAKAIDNIAKAVNGVTLVLGTAIGLVNKFRQGYTNFLMDPLGTGMGGAGASSTNRSASPAGTAVRLRQQREAEAAAVKRAKEVAALTKKQVASTKALTAEQKKQASLKKSGTVFDLEQIQIVAALKGQVTKEEELRLQAQLALLNGNADLAARLTNEILKAQDASGNLSRFLAALPNAKNPFEYLDAYLSYLGSKAAAISLGTSFGQSAPSVGAAAPVAPIPATNVPSMPSDGMITYNTRTGLNYNPNANNVVVELKITGEGDVTNAIAKGLQNQSLSTGDSSYINRRTGGFAG